jgi:hypothetical protein
VAPGKASGKKATATAAKKSAAKRRSG